MSWAASASVLMVTSSTFRRHASPGWCGLPGSAGRLRDCMLRWGRRAGRKARLRVWADIRPALGEQVVFRVGAVAVGQRSAGVAKVPDVLVTLCADAAHGLIGRVIGDFREYLVAHAGGVVEEKREQTMALQVVRRREIQKCAQGQTSMWGRVCKTHILNPFHPPPGWPNVLWTIRTD